MIEVQDLVKRYGDFTAVNGISFNVQRGQVMGFLGPNGAGKSTTMKMITGFLPASSGTVLVNGRDTYNYSLEARASIGYLPENAPSYGEMTVYEFLRFIAEMRGIKKSQLARRIEETVDLTGLDAVLGQMIETLSKGYKQRVCFAQAVIHDPPVLILDEPTDGLDPNQKHHVRTLIRKMGEKKCIILSTHILEEMEAVCDTAMIVASGKIVAEGTPAELSAMSTSHHAVKIKTTLGNQDWLSKLENLPEVARVESLSTDEEGVQYRIFPTEKQPIVLQVSRLLQAEKVEVLEILSEKGQIDEVFREVTRRTAS